MNNRKYTALCGLYCRDCIPSNERIYALVEELLREFASTGFGNYAALKADRSAVFGEFRTAERVLREILKLKCSGSCLEGPRSELGCAADCEIRTCALASNLDGCWQCDERVKCQRIERISVLHPGIRDNLEVIAERGIECWPEHRGRHYEWTPE
jgi:hypothetical protein